MTVQSSSGSAASRAAQCRADFDRGMSNEELRAKYGYSGNTLFKILNYEAADSAAKQSRMRLSKSQHEDEVSIQVDGYPAHESLEVDPQDRPQPSKPELLRIDFEAGLTAKQAADKQGVPYNNAWKIYNTWQLSTAQQTSTTDQETD